MVYETKVDWEYEQKCTTSYEKECHGYGYHQECEDVSIDKPNLYLIWGYTRQAMITFQSFIKSTLL